MYSLEAKGLVSKPVDDIAEALPCHHFDKYIRQVVRRLHVTV
jgi:hypothetical protein